MDISKIKLGSTSYDIKDTTARTSISNLSTVASSGSYVDLSNKPTIGSGVLTVQKNGTSVGTFSANETSDKTINITVPTNQDISDAVAAAIGDITSISYEVVQSLPATGESGVIYLISNSGSGTNVYDEYIYVNNSFEKLGSTEINLDSYLQYDANNSGVNVGTTLKYGSTSVPIVLNTKPTAGDSKLSQTAPTWNAMDSAISSAVNNANLTIQKNGTTVKTFSASASFDNFLYNTHTIECYYEPQTYGEDGDAQMLFVGRNQKQTIALYCYYYNNQVNFIRSSSTSTKVLTISPPTLNQKHYIAANNNGWVFDGVYYPDSESSATTSSVATNDILNVSGQYACASVGMRFKDGRDPDCFTGKIYAMRIHNSVLTKNQLLHNMTCDIARFQ